ncbi:unnamed protein product [Clonostachys rosea]|uniref:F-box domain-containing protein n=1 Tax=Bionectria ochroleuca TaxID=29856 RepID=A0ABY6UVV4_BIOOC|nr:unnamed protein product [Clonostachys rosea]
MWRQDRVCDVMKVVSRKDLIDAFHNLKHEDDVLMGIFGVVSLGIWFAISPFILAIIQLGILEYEIARFSAKCRQKRERIRRDRSLELMCLDSKSRKKKEKHKTRNRFLRWCFGARSQPDRAIRSQSSGPCLFFTRLPPEIRRQILIHAFGSRTVHLDLSFRHPFRVISHDKCRLLGQSPEAHLHAGISTRFGLFHPNIVLYDESEKKKWRWFSCVCHRARPHDPLLSYGRRSSVNHLGSTDNHEDNCLSGEGTCVEWPGEVPEKCFIGATGWLLACKQAHDEGIEVLYQTNTIQISSPVLLQGAHDILSPFKLSMIRSLELALDGFNVRLSQVLLGVSPNRPTSSSGASAPLQTRKPLFPSLAFLRLFLKSDQRFLDDDFRDSLRQSRYGRKNTEERLLTFTLPSIDDLVNRIVSPTTDVTVTFREWMFYSLMDLKLAEVQGLEETRLQRADIGGLKFWRKTPHSGLEQQTSDGNGSSTNKLREGYWVHISQMPKTGGGIDEQDEERRKLYGLD